MNKTSRTVTISQEIQKVLDAFFRFEMREHKKDGETALASLRKVFHDIVEFSDLGNRVIVSADERARSLPRYAFHVAAALQFLALAVKLQKSSGKIPLPRGLSISHFPLEKQKHAKESVELVLGDLSLVLMHNLLVHMPAPAKDILKYEQIFAELTKNIFSSCILDSRYRPLADLKKQAKLLGTTFK